YFNTVHDTARHGIITDGSQMEIVGNDVYNAVMRNRWWQSNFWDAAISSDPTRSQWGFTLRGNSIRDSWGECADILAVDGATGEGNRTYNCVSPNLFVSGSRNGTVNRNWIYEAPDQYNRPDLGYRAAGIELANEGAASGWSVSDIRITNNIVEWV